MNVLYPDVEVQLTGTSGNVFSIIGLVTKALRRAGHVEAASKFSNDAMSQAS